MGDEVVQAFEQDGRTMVYTRSGANTGIAFVLVHGIGMGHRVFRDLADRLQKRGYGTGRIEKILGRNFLSYAQRIWGA